MESDLRPNPGALHRIEEWTQTDKGWETQRNSYQKDMRQNSQERSLRRPPTLQACLLTCSDPQYQSCTVHQERAGANISKHQEIIGHCKKSCLCRVFFEETGLEFVKDIMINQDSSEFVCNNFIWNLKIKNILEMGQ